MCILYQRYQSITFPFTSWNQKKHNVTACYNLVDIWYTYFNFVTKFWSFGYHPSFDLASTTNDIISLNKKLHWSWKSLYVKQKCRSSPYCFSMKYFNAFICRKERHKTSSKAGFKGSPCNWWLVHSCQVHLMADKVTISCHSSEWFPRTFHSFSSCIWILFIIIDLSSYSLHKKRWEENWEFCLDAENTNRDCKVLGPP